MCIAIITTAHPQYPFILLNNRDEYLHRPTAPAQWWAEPHSHVLGGYDLHRPVHGTWLGITRQGRIAVLTNFREEGAAIIQDERSRGAIPIAWLTTPPDSDEGTADFAQRLVDEGTLKHVGGFSMLYGRLQDVVKTQQHDAAAPTNGNGPVHNKGLAIVSNRTPDVKGLIWLAGEPGETRALSNSHYGDNSWPKIVQGEASLRAAVDDNVSAAGEPQEALLERLFAVLSADTMPRQRNGEEWETYLRQLRNSIFIPGIGHDATVDQKPADAVAAATGVESVSATSGIYGTQKQTVILVDREGKVTFVERTLYDHEGKPVKGGKEDRRFDFQIEGW
ncbi:Uncharacterized protein DIS24_g2001 [Lasiodiplodia hormozganensis]|uniref:Transport and Golgi organization protein 2-like protein n=1 Tax=Lasiodiplodia hormozganensis TaxID=869390 RepID=A0AA39Z1S2_9PEZI|nr:Uncharacterized protein DIS24_g2001 [Lasiodiplodia hormozganensis]